ncbi:unnamed protein product [Linum tenue]|uniref:RNase H type-1 domain-containing protein n=1 Tax=Linum tenue TaxID=586396 RepID=A0AAV0PK12_9ROSI|nr:unnamed protein product [Linum tenue]
MTNAERARRHLTTNVDCNICGGGPETALHVVRDCPFARATWAGILEDEPDVDFLEPELHRWSMHYLSGRSKVIDSTLFAGTCWLLCKNRNDHLFRSELKTHEQLQFSTKQLRLQLTKAFEKESNIFGDGGLRERRDISWKLPPSGWACVNTDGLATHSPASTSCGGIVRGDDGRFIKAFTTNLGGGSITRAELAGIAYGLRFAWEEGIRKVVLQTDSCTARTLIENATPQHPHYSCIAEIRQWLARPWLVRIEHRLWKQQWATRSRRDDGDTAWQRRFISGDDAAFGRSMEENKASADCGGMVDGVLEVCRKSPPVYRVGFSF